MFSGPGFDASFQRYKINNVNNKELYAIFKVAICNDMIEESEEDAVVSEMSVWIEAISRISNGNVQIENDLLKLFESCASFAAKSYKKFVLILYFN